MGNRSGEIKTNSIVSVSKCLLTEIRNNNYNQISDQYSECPIRNNQQNSDSYLASVFVRVKNYPAKLTPNFPMKLRDNPHNMNQDSDSCPINLTFNYPAKLRHNYPSKIIPKYLPKRHAKLSSKYPTDSGFRQRAGTRSNYLNKLRPKNLAITSSERPSKGKPDYFIKLKSEHSFKTAYSPDNSTDTTNRN